MISKEQLKMRRYVAVIDQSGSMGDPVRKGSNQSKWDYARESTVALARKCEELGGALDVYTFNGGYRYYGNAKADQVAEIFRKESPVGGTNFVPVLEDVVKRHFEANKPTTCMIVTDGAPSDGAAGQKALAKLIINAANRIEADGDLGLGFIQVGDDAEATAFLQQLDDGLQSAGAKFDIVDTKTAEELEKVGLEAALLAAVND